MFTADGADRGTPEMRVLSLIAAFAAAGAALAAPTASAKDLIIFAHNKFFETKKAGEAHPRFGVYDLAGIHKALSENADLIAPERSADADPSASAQQIADLVAAEIAAGRKPSEIKVVGGSKGAIIAMLASERLKQPEISYVLLGGCAPAFLQRRTPALTGRVLSIYETTDTVAGACPEAAFSANAAEYREIALSTDLDHGFQFVAHPDWVTPALAW